MQRILVAVDDSAAGLAATRVAVGLAAQLGASLRLVHVIADSPPATALFRHVEALARAAGVEAEHVELYGDPARLILEQARTWPAELIVIGRGLEREVGGPYVGREARMVLEFADQPVLVVPAQGSGLSNR
jgi:nucleotide-binding universal stress UspA family protein